MMPFTPILSLKYSIKLASAFNPSLKHRSGRVGRTFIFDTFREWALLVLAQNNTVMPVARI